MLTYAKAVQLVRTSRTGRRKLTHNTYLVQRSEDSFAVELHGNTILLIHKDDSYTLFSGWRRRTNLTKQRINAFSPARIYQKDFEWYVNGEKFTEGMRINTKKPEVQGVLG